jgi:methylphosphotriester-DNA--protein-cysteine methyltransferase
MNCAHHVAALRDSEFVACDLRGRDTESGLHPGACFDHHWRSAEIIFDAPRVGVVAQVLLQYYLAETHVTVPIALSKLRADGLFFRSLLRDGTKTISEAMYAAGFGSYAQFHRVFTQAYGGGPREALRPVQTGVR